MNSTRDILQRARGDRRADTAPLRGVTSAVPQFEQPAPPDTELPKYVAVPQPIHENSIYRQLMRSHDRVSTRHIRG